MGNDGNPEKSNYHLRSAFPRVCIEVILESYMNNGKENGNYYTMIGLGTANNR